MLMGGARLEYVERLIHGDFPADFLSLSRAIRYYMISDDYEQLVSILNGEGARTLLTALLSNRNLTVAKDEHLMCAPVGRLRDWPEQLLHLAISVDRNLFSADPATNRDSKVFSRNQVRVHHDPEQITRWVIDGLHGPRVVKTWVLHDGGETRAREVLGPSIVTAKSTQIYDRYFGSHSLETISDSLDFAVTQRGNKLDLEISIYTRKQPSPGTYLFLDYSTIARRLRSYLCPDAVINIGELTLSTSTQSSLHDRYVKIDDSYTFDFSAGVGCFYEGRSELGRNRSSHVYQMSIVTDHEIFEFSYNVGGRIVGCQIKV